MPEYFETRGLPDDEAHWDALAAKVAAGARRGSTPPLDWIAHSRVSLVLASALLLLAGAWVLLPTGGSSRPASLEQVIGPGDEIGQQMLTAESPPAVAALLFEPPGVHR
jgi:hypothetical protein